MAVLSQIAPPKGYVPLAGSERRPAPHAKLLGPADDAEAVAITVVLRRRADGAAVPDFDYFAKTPPQRRQRLPAAVFAARHGAHPDDVAKIVKFAEAAGLKVTETSLARRSVKVSGTARQMSAAFAVPLGTYEYTIVRNRKRPRPVETTYRGRDGFIHVPEDIAPIIVGVFGLDNRKVGHRAGNPGDPPVTNPISLQQVTSLYKFPSPGAGISAQTIGVISLSGGYGGYVQSDIDAYFGSIGVAPMVFPVTVDGIGNGAFSAVTTAASAVGQSTLTFGAVPAIPAGSYGSFNLPSGTIYIFVPGAPASDTITVEVWDQATQQYVTTGFTTAAPVGTTVYFNLDGETNQDICIAGGAARKANVAVYNSVDSQAGWIGLIGQAIHPNPGDLPAGVNPPSVLTSSWSIAPGDDPDGLAYGDMYWGTGVTTGAMTAMDLYFQDAALNAMTICMDTDDLGSNMYVGSVATSASETAGDGYAHVVYPATDPWVLAVGGTTLGQYQPQGSANLEWVEYVWNDPFQDPGYPWGTTGGGVSDYFPVPSYQAGAGVPVSVNTTYTPNPATVTVTPPAPFNQTGRGIPDVSANASYNSGYSGIILGGAPTIGNGTSASTPLWAGLIALLNSNLGYNVGFINPIIYEWGPGLFSPINPLWPDPAYPQLAGCPADNSNNGIPGYKAGPGWDACTGLGSPNGAALLEAFQTLGEAFIYGGYQSADIILTDLTTMTPVPLGGAPGGPWDTLLQPNVPYGFSAQVHNASSTKPAYIDSVSFWAIPGGVGVAGGTLLDTVGVEGAIPPGGSITVASTQSFVNPGSHMCAVVSLYSTSAGYLFDGAADSKSQDIPSPGAAGSHSGSAWRNTDSMTVGGGGAYKFTLGFETVPRRLPEPIRINIESLHVPFDWNRDPRIRQIQSVLDATGARSNIPLFLLPEFVGGYRSSHLKNRIGVVKGGNIAERRGHWYLDPEAGAKATSFEISGEVPKSAKVGDIIVVNVDVQYPAAAGRDPRSVGFMEFIHVVDARRTT